jgi:hypothetical protein
VHRAPSAQSHLDAHGHTDADSHPYADPHGAQLGDPDVHPHADTDTQRDLDTYRQRHPAGILDPDAHPLADSDFDGNGLAERHRRSDSGGRRHGDCDDRQYAQRDAFAHRIADELGHHDSDVD